MLQTIKIDGFKSIASMSLDLGVVNCFIGANGVGKTNILEAIGVLGAAANGTVDDESLLRRGVRPGVPRLYKSSFEGERTPPHIGMGAVARDGAEYRVSLLNPLDNPNPAWEFKTEFLTDGKQEIVSEGVRSQRRLGPARGLAALKMVDLARADPAFRLLSLLQNYAIYSPSTPVLRGMVGDPQSRDPLGLAGGRLAAAFSSFRGSTLADDEVEDSLFGLLDWVQNVETTSGGHHLLSPSVARQTEVLRFTDRFMNKNRNQLTAYDASEGALYVLFCAILCLSEQAPRCLSLDNLDQALNPRLVARLTGQLYPWLRRSGAGRQLLFTTHNPAALDGLDLTDNEVRLFSVDRDNRGRTVATRVEPSAELLKLHEQYPLSRLWLMGHLGAVPNV